MQKIHADILASWAPRLCKGIQAGYHTLPLLSSEGCPPSPALLEWELSIVSTCVDHLCLQSCPYAVCGVQHALDLCRRRCQRGSLYAGLRIQHAPDDVRRQICLRCSSVRLPLRSACSWSTSVKMQTMGLLLSTLCPVPPQRSEIPVNKCRGRQRPIVTRVAENLRLLGGGDPELGSVGRAAAHSDQHLGSERSQWFNHKPG